MNGYHRVILHGKLHRNQPGKLKNKGTLFEKKAPKDGVVRGSNFEILCKTPTNYIPFNAQWKTEQLLWRHLMVIYYGMRGMEVWMGQTHKNDKKYSKIHNFCKIKRIRKIFSGYSSWRAILHFCFLEYRAITLSCYHMGPWYTTHMVPEWYYTKMGIIRLEIDWRVIFESISINFSKWFHYTIIVIGYNHLSKMTKNVVFSNDHKRR